MVEDAKQEESGMKRVLACFVMASLLSGCGAQPFARELEATMLVQVLGVDWTAKEVELTAACDPGTGSGGSKTSVLAAKGTDFERAKEALKGAGEEYVSLTHVAQIVLGAETVLPVVLEAALKEPALSQSATVWFSESGTAKELLTSVDGGAKRVAAIELNSGVEPITVLQSLMRLKEQGWVEVPVLCIEEGVLTLGGTVMVSEEERET